MPIPRAIPGALALILTLGPCCALDPSPAVAAGGSEVRVFVALPVPDAVAKLHMAQQERLRRQGFEFHRVARDDQHLTLHFIGEIPASKVDELSRALEGVASRHARFDLEHRGLGYFTKGDDAEPFVIWGGCGDGFKPLADLADDISDAAGKVGLPPRRGSFKAHVTLGRPTDRSQGDALKKDLDSHRELDLGRERVDRFGLYRTIKDATAGSFEKLHEFRLKD